ncbi:MAG: hypothetical protein BYD32DRAFT_406599 [Podila humilis]|nr:MAG: hypothetical protein BYD32DRAFT_406599 [Podila humilis]
MVRCPPHPYHTRTKENECINTNKHISPSIQRLSSFFLNATMPCALFYCVCACLCMSSENACVVE